MKITSKYEYKKLEARINLARDLREAGKTYAEIASELGVTPPTAHSYIVSGEEILARNLPQDNKKPDEDWEKISEALYKVYLSVGEPTFRILFNMWLKEKRSKSFKEFVESYFNKKGISI